MMLCFVSNVTVCVYLGASSSSRVHVTPARNTAVDIDCVGAAGNGLRRDDSDNTRSNEEVWNV